VPISTRSATSTRRGSTTASARQCSAPATGRYEHCFGCQVVELDGTTAVDQLGRRWPADVVIVCPGAALDGLTAEHLSTASLRRCQLQMMETEELGEQLTTSVADADSMRYYPAYEHVDLVALGEQDPGAAAARLQLLMVQRLDGGLTIGDTHLYDEPFPFDVDEQPYRQLVARAEAILGRPLPPIVRRWSGVYAEIDPAESDDRPGAIYHHAELAPGVVVVTGAGGRGMTLSPAIAERTWDGLT